MGRMECWLSVESSDSLLNGLKVLIESPELRWRLGEELHMKVMTNLTSERIIPLYKQTYNKILIK
jgi:hypothetical protein